MDAGQALADLTEISSQVEAAVLADSSGAAVASTFVDEAKGGEVARAAAELLEAAAESGREGLVQLEAATPEGSVFVVRDGDRFVVAVTGTQPTVGLVFYDLKTCLRLLDEGKEQEKAAGKSSRGGRRKAGGGEA